MTAHDPKMALSSDSFSDVEITESSKERRSQVRLSRRAYLKTQELKTPSMSIGLLGVWVRAFDFIAIAFTSLCAYMGTQNEPLVQFNSLYFTAIAFASLLGVVLFQAFSVYNVQSYRKPSDQLGRMLSAWLCLFAALATIAFLAKIGESFSRQWFVIWLWLGILIFAGARITLTALVANWMRQGKLQRRAVIVGGGKAAEELISSLNSNAVNDIQIIGIFDDRDDERISPSLGDYEKLGNIAELVEFGRKTQIDMLIVTLPMAAQDRVMELLKQLWVLPVDIRLSAHNSKLRFRPRSYTYLGSTPLLPVMDKPIADVNSLVKRAFDLVLSVFFIILLSPLMLVTYCAIRLESKGPAIFKQKRHGFNNDLVTVFKFRSMYVETCEDKVQTHVTKGDPRVTRIGRFIRKTSIDELPQFFNVLKGDLSLVGPRPHAVASHMHNQTYSDIVEGYFARHKVKPGITGWAQVNGYRGEIDAAEKIQKRIEHDLYYIENWSILFDLYIVILTPWKLIFDTENAY